LPNKITLVLNALFQTSQRAVQTARALRQAKIAVDLIVYFIEAIQTQAFATGDAGSHGLSINMCIATHLPIILAQNRSLNVNKEVYFLC